MRLIIGRPDRIKIIACRLLFFAQALQVILIVEFIHG
jgi:hypothetical protein